MERPEIVPRQATDIAVEDGLTQFIILNYLKVFIFYKSRVMVMYVLIEEADQLTSRGIFGVQALMVKDKVQTQHIPQQKANTVGIGYQVVIHSLQVIL